MPSDLPERALWLEAMPRLELAGISGRDVFGDGSVLAVNLPGHAVGQHGLLCRTSKGPIFFVADAAAHSWILTRGNRPRLPRLISHDDGAQQRTQRWLEGLTDRCWMVPSHCPLAYRRGPLAT